MMQRKNIIDYVGKRQGRITFMRPLKTYRGNSREILWWCDCGSVCITMNSAIYTGSPISCGCIKHLRKATKFRCPGCGSFFDGDLSQNPTQQFCQDCAPKYSDGTWRVCAVCKQLFQVTEGKDTETCSPACSEQWRMRVDPQYIEELTRHNYELAGLSETIFDESKNPKGPEIQSKKHPGVYQYGNIWKVYTMYRGTYRYCVSFDSLDVANHCSELLRNCANDKEIDSLLTEIREKKKEYKQKKKNISKIDLSPRRSPEYICENTIYGTTYYMVYRNIGNRRVDIGYFQTSEEASSIAERVKKCTSVEELLALKEEVKSQRRNLKNRHPGVYLNRKRWSVSVKRNGTYRYCASFDSLDVANHCSDLLRNCADEKEFDALLTDIRERFKPNSRTPSYITKINVKGQTYFAVYRNIDKRRITFGCFLTIEEARPVADRVKQCASLQELLDLKEELKSQRKNRRLQEHR